MIAVGDYYLKPSVEILTRVSCPFGGGVGGCRDELCGVLSGATIVLGALWGRVASSEDDKWLYEAVCAYRERFIAAFGGSACRPLREPFEQRNERCVPIVTEGVRLLVELIEETAERLPEQAPLACRVRRS